MIISVHNVNLFVSRDFLFESKNTKLIMYAHLVDVSTIAILIRNDKNISVKISRNYRLNRVFELDFSNVFHIDNSDDVRHLAIKKSKTSHKDEWFKKLISVCATTYVAVIVIKIETTSIDFFNLINVFILFSTSEVSDLSIASLFDLKKTFSNDSNSSETVLFNDVTIYNFESNIVDSFVKIVNDFSTLWHDIDFVSMSENKWMRISLKSDWKTRVFDKIKIYSLEIKDRELIDKTFDELHRTDKLFWINESTFFSYSIFCVWKTIKEERKDRMIVDIRDLNVIIQSNVYSLSFQTNILSLIRDCKYIFVIDCFAFFYQWRMHSTDRHKLIVVSHRNQKSFNVTIMNYKNSSIYVQRQINRLLRTFREFARAYVDDIVIFSHIKKEHKFHLRRVFIVLIENNIFIKVVKVFFDYSSISLLNQKVDSFDLITFEKKLKTISKFRFSRTLRQLEIYLSLIDWMRNYVSYYVDIFKSLQNRKIELLRHDSTIDSVRRFYSIKIRLKDSIELEITFFEILQIMLSKSFYLTHVDIKRSLFIDLDVNKKFDFEIMLYYVKKSFLKNSLKDKYSSRHAIESILFFSRLITNAKSRYWLTELEIAELVWVLKKTRHIVETSINKSIIYIDHDATLEIANQTIFTISSTDKLNFRLVRAFDYIQRFNLKIRHKLDKQHIVSDALFRLISVNINSSRHEKDELDALFTVSLVEMNFVFKQRILNDYKTNLNWQKIVSTLNQNVELNSENVASLSFYRRKNDLIFRFEDITIDDHVYESCRLCISHFVVSNILRLTHDDDHVDYVRCFEKISFFYYIRDLSRYLRDYLKHCSQCQIYQTRRHASYDSLQSILISSISFHIIIIDFIFVLSLSRQEFDTIMSIFCKFFKRDFVVFDKKIWFVREWDIALFDRLDIANWNLSKIIISNKDRKFLFDMWTIIFEKLKVKFMYSTIYHSQIDEQSERTNQIIEIVFRFYLIIMKNSVDWSNVLIEI